MQPRYFIGIELPDAISQIIADIQQDLFSSHKVMQPLQPHITLLHPNILQTLPPMFFLPKVKAAAEEFLPLQINLTGTSMFDKRVLHIAVESPSLLKLHKAVSKLLPDSIRAQYEVGRPYTPHVTLAQAKPKQKLADDLIDSFKARIESNLPQTFSAAHLSQFKWLRPRTYRVVKI